MRIAKSLQFILTVVGGLATIAGLIAGANDLWTRFHRPSSNLVATVTFGPQFWPPQLSNRLGLFADTPPTPDSLVSLFEPKPITYAIKQRKGFAVGNLTMAIVDELVAKSDPNSIDLPRLRSAIETAYDDDADMLSQSISADLNSRFIAAKQNWPVDRQGFYFVQVKNKGSLAAKDVSVLFPDEAVVEIRGGGRSPATAKGHSFEIGQMGAADSLDIIAWVTIAPSVRSARGVVVRYADGLAERSVVGEPSWLDEFLDTYGFPLLLTFPLIVVSCWMIVILLRQSLSARDANAVDTSGDQTTEPDARPSEAKPSVLPSE